MKKLSAILSLTFMLISLVGAMLLELLPIGPQFDGAQEMRRAANVRVCPRLDCESSGIYEVGRPVVVIRTVGGELVEESRAWEEIEYGDETRFVHSKFVDTEVTPVAAWIVIVAVFSAMFLVGISMTISSSRLRSIATIHPAATDRALLTIAVCGGLFCGGIAYVISRGAGESTATFISAALANIGAGLIGAGVAFVLFQSLLSERGIGPAQLEEVRSEIAELRGTFDASNRVSPTEAGQHEEVLDIGVAAPRPSTAAEGCAEAAAERAADEIISERAPSSGVSAPDESGLSARQDRSAGDG